MNKIVLLIYLHALGIGKTKYFYCSRDYCNCSSSLNYNLCHFLNIILVYLFTLNK